MSGYIELRRATSLAHISLLRCPGTGPHTPLVEKKRAVETTATKYSLLCSYHRNSFRRIPVTSTAVFQFALDPEKPTGGLVPSSFPPLLLKFPAAQKHGKRSADLISRLLARR